MHKILLAFFILVTLIFPKSEVLAADACEQKCTNGAPIQSDGKCPATGIGNPIIFSCSDPKTHPDLSSGSCLCEAGAPAPATATSVTTANPPTATPCSGPGCTSGKGKPCTPGATTDTDTGPGIKTAIGCIPTEPKALVGGILKFGTLAAGGIAFLLMILGALQMITAEGNPENIKHGQERFYSAIIGLLLVIFAVLLMQVIGVDILGLNNFGVSK